MSSVLYQTDPLAITCRILLHHLLVHGTHTPLDASCNDHINGATVVNMVPPRPVYDTVVA